jgi:general nucleoside transport system permease protein
VEVFLWSTLTLSAPLILAAMGGLTSERGGVINIALEGKMLGAAVVTALVAVQSDNAVLGLGAGIVAATVLSLLHWLMTQTYRIDHIISGMAINAIAFGASNFLDRKFLSAASGAVPVLPVSLYYAAAFALPVALGLYLAKTRGGLRLLAVGQDPDKSRQMGLSPIGVRFGGLLATGVFCGLAGALVVSQATRFVDNMTSGRGFIALAALILGAWRPIPAALACFAFGAFQALQIQLQGTELMGARIPPEVWQSLPYAVTVVALAGLLGRSRAPSGLGKV